MGYAGGKGRIWQNIVSLMPPHERYIETHLGGGSVLRNKRPAKRSIGIDLDHRVITAATSWMIPNLTLRQCDAVAFLKNNEFEKGDLIYADPPYVASTKAYRRYYRYEYTDADHLRLLKTLVRLQCAVMISGYRCGLYDELLEGWNSVSLINITHAGLREEVVWANFPFSSDLHEYDRVGGSFRERERIKRKLGRWVVKFEQMPVLEQRAVLSALLRSSDVDIEFLQRALDGVGERT